MNHKQARLKHEILAVMSRLNNLIREFSYEDSPAANPTIASVIELIAVELGTTPKMIRTQSNEPHIVLPRQICQYVIRQTLNSSYPEIALATGIGDHTTVLHSCRKIEKMRAANPEFDKKMRSLCGKFLDRGNASNEEEDFPEEVRA